MSGYNFNLLCNCWYTRDSCLVYLCVNRAHVSILFLSRTKASARSTSHTTILFLFYIYVIIYIYILSRCLFLSLLFIFLSFYLESFHKFIIFLNGNIFNLFDPLPNNNNRRFEFENGRVFCIFWRFFSCFCFCHLLVLSRMEKIILYRVKMVEIGLSKSGKSRAKFWNG